MNTFSAFRAQTWHGQQLVSDIEPLSIDAAREIARTAPMTGHTGRIMSMTEDYCEVYSKDGSVRRGTFGATTVVKYMTDGGEPLNG